MKNNKGFSLLELMVTMGIFLLILLPVYFMIFHYSDIYKTENSRVKLQQESRFVLTNLATELKSVGNVLTLAKSGYWLKSRPHSLRRPASDDVQFSFSFK